MKHKIYLFLCIIFFGFVAVQAQNNYSGNWEGTITMEKDGKIVATFKFVLHLMQDNKLIEGRSWVWYKEAKAVFSVGGTFKDNLLKINDLNTIEADNIPSGEWCLKSMELQLIHNKKQDRLEGVWQGKTSFSQCTPGKIYLKRIINRA